MVAIFLGSSLTGLNHGVKWLSNLNIFIRCYFTYIYFDFGDLKFILESYTLAISDYLQHFI